MPSKTRRSAQRCLRGAGGAKASLARTATILPTDAWGSTRTCADREPGEEFESSPRRRRSGPGLIGV